MQFLSMQSAFIFFKQFNNYMKLPCYNYPPSNIVPSTQDVLCKCYSVVLLLVIIQVPEN